MIYPGSLPHCEPEIIDELVAWRWGDRIVSSVCFSSILRYYHKLSVTARDTQVFFFHNHTLCLFSFCGFAFGHVNGHWRLLVQVYCKFIAKGHAYRRLGETWTLYPRCLLITQSRNILVRRIVSYCSRHKDSSWRRSSASCHPDCVAATPSPCSFPVRAPHVDRSIAVWSSNFRFMSRYRPMLVLGWTWFSYDEVSGSFYSRRLFRTLRWFLPVPRPEPD